MENKKIGVAGLQQAFKLKFTPLFAPTINYFRGAPNLSQILKR